ncbi:hypothetical protein RHSIM_Rhsim02G0225600 [Rhododendron simsii]|uniref:KIB1-4 beta-propeller domain-containing protein n=1 Tax=Rhododendron simsii TaxID=118357 RepID=A0A834HCN9_RHOSS|nr:hypothetical protein RHSIM_Rhsim02G0225600 [Rhododendron simsii]
MYLWLYMDAADVLLFGDLIEDKSWTAINAGLISFCYINFYIGLCYGVTSNGMVLAFDVWGHNPTLAWHVGHGPREFIGHSGFKLPYIVQSAEVECVEKTSLGDNALFLGDNSSVSVDATTFHGIKSNSIYYNNNLQQGADLCIYMEDGSHRPCYEEESSSLTYPPMWVNPSSF